MIKFPFLYRTSGISKWGPVDVWLKNLKNFHTDWSRALWGFYELLGVNPIPLPNLKEFCFCSCVTELCLQRPHVLEEGGSVLEAGISYPWAVQEQCVSLLHISRKPCTAWAWPWWMSLALLQISTKQHIKHLYMNMIHSPSASWPKTKASYG